MDSLKRFSDPVYCITRFIVGLMFACHGGQKIFHFPPGGYPATNAWGWWAGGIELVCGFFVAFGLLTRLAAFFASGEMAVAFLTVGFSGKSLGHAPTVLERLLPMLNGTESAVLYCWFFFFFVFYGAGQWSIEALIKHRSTSTGSSSPRHAPPGGN